jgi:hypothetical protein
MIQNFFFVNPEKRLMCFEDKNSKKLNRVLLNKGKEMIVNSCGV